MICTFRISTEVDVEGLDLRRSRGEGILVHLAVVGGVLAVVIGHLAVLGHGEGLETL